MSNQKFVLSRTAGLALLCAAGIMDAGAKVERDSEHDSQDRCRHLVHCHGEVGDVVVVADGLHSPRGLDFAPNGQLFVAEAGDEATGYSETGVVSRINYWLDAQYARVPVLTGLPAYGDVGPADISFQGMKAYVPIGIASDADSRAALTGAKKNLLGTLISFYPHTDDIKQVADLTALERASNADGYGPDNPRDIPYDSNPFGVLALPGRQIVVDAGANDVYAIKSNGHAQLLAVFTAEPDPLTGAQHIPSRVAQGPDGYLYVGEEAFSLSEAHVYKIPPGGCDTASPTDCKSHFLTDSSGNAVTFGHIMDLEFDRVGNLYVLEYPGFGGPPSGNDLIKVDRRGNKTVIYSGLSNPGGMALSSDGQYAYVSNRTTCWGVAYQPAFPAGAPLSCADPQSGAGLYGEVLRISLTAN